MPILWPQDDPQGPPRRGQDGQGAVSMLLLTTSRKPSRRTRRFCRELASVIPFSLCVNRGKASIRKLVDRAVADGFSRVFILLETKGNPSAIRVLDVSPRGWGWLGELYISSVSLLLDRGCRPRRLDADGLCVRGDRYGDVLSQMFSPLECTESSVRLVEQSGHVHFEYGSERVGPSFEVVGWSAVPKALEQ